MDAFSALRRQGEDGLPVLAFKVDSLQFDLNRDLKFISMKDQLIRGRTLVLAAYQAGLIRSTLRPGPNSAHVIIIGAGIGGISAALMACELGLKVKVVERSNDCFSLLNLGSDRLFSATVYDWPHAHSRSHEFPYVSDLRDDNTIKRLRAEAATLRFPDRPKTSAKLRTHFKEQLDDYQGHYGENLKILYGHRLNRMGDITTNVASKLVTVKTTDPHGALQYLEGQIVIVALGFGLDKNNEQTAAAKDFFAYNSLNLDVAKAISNGGPVRILGAGDGGLQEALRFVLDDDSHDLHKCVTELETILAGAGHEALWYKICSRLQSAEDQATRSLMWGYSEDHIYRELDAVYERELTLLLGAAGPAIREWHKRVARKGSFKVQLIDKSTYSTKTYALNRWLVGLLQRMPAVKGRVTIERLVKAPEGETPSVELKRYGFAGGTKQGQIGTAGKKELLRRLAFEGIPMNLDAVV